MKLPRRRFLHLAAGAAALPVISGAAHAEAYPAHPVRWLIGFPPGGAVDIVARIMGHWLSEHFGQQFLVENRAVGLVATGIVALSLESVGVALVFFGIGGLLIKLA